MTKNNKHIIKILHCIYDLNYGGAEKVLFQITNHLDKDKFENLICYFSDNEDMLEIFQQANAKLIKVRLTNKNNYLKAIKDLVYLIKNEDINIIHTNRYFDSIAASIAGLITHTPVVNTLHSRSNPYSKPFKFKKTLYGLIQDFFLNYFVKINIAVSNQIKTEYTDKRFIREKKMQVIYSGVETRKEFEKNTNRITKIKAELSLTGHYPILLNVGRLVHEKAQSNILEVMKKIKNDYPAAIALITGDGPLKNTLKDIIVSNDLSENVKLLGNRNDVRELLRASDIFVLPSLTEGLPIALIEAMMEAKPIIASNVGGIPELITHMESGLLMIPGDKQQLLQSVYQLLENKDLALKLGINAQKVAMHKFNIINTIKDYEKLYLRMIS